MSIRGEFGETLWQKPRLRNGNSAYRGSSEEQRDRQRRSVSLSSHGMGTPCIVEAFVAFVAKRFMLNRSSPPKLMQNVQPRATLRDIARRAGYHYSTVSLALREHPRIPAATRNRIRKIADALGYRPDAALSALCAYREQKLPAHRQSVIAWLTNHRTPGQWQRSACNRDYFAGASLRAAERGYTIESFWLAEPGMTGRRMSQILWTRGIQGILLPPQERICSIDLDWDKLSAVTFGYTLVQPRLNLVSNHDYRTMGTLFAELQRRRYRRVGLVNLRDHDERVDHNWLAAYLVEENRVCPENRLVPLIMGRWSDELFLDWFSKNKPDAIVTRLPEVLSCLEHAGFRVPTDVGVAFHSLDEGRRGFSGMKKNSFQIGIMAVDLLVDMLHRNERGVPIIPYMLMVEGSWCEGRTLRPAAEAKAGACLHSGKTSAGQLKSTV